MKQNNLEKIISLINSVHIRDKVIPLVYTGVNFGGGFTHAFEFENQETTDKYYLKITEITDTPTDEIAVLTKVNQQFRNEVLSEPDAAKRLGYLPVPEILTDDLDQFNPEFMRLLDRNHYTVQLQSAGRGIHCEKQLPESLPLRIELALNFAKVLRSCARNKIAYVDVKPLEHLFWSEEGGKIQITLIDWGIARQNASGFLLLDDLRKYCVYLPELIYGNKMLDLVNQGKYEYPIQKENDRVLIRMLGQLSFNNINPPLNQKYAQLVGDMLVGSLNDARIQNKIVEIWDDVLRVLGEALDASREENKNVVSCESLKKEAESQISKEQEFFLDRDFRRILSPRLISLTSYKAWLIPAIRAVQLWYGKIDLIPNQSFDTCVHLVITDQSGRLNSEFKKLAGMIGDKAAACTGSPELIPILLEHLKQIQNVIFAWDFLSQAESGQISPEIFQAAFNTSNLRVIDPLLAEAYRRQARHLQENPDMPAEEPPQPVKAEEKPMETLNEDHEKDKAKKKAQPVLDTFHRASNFTELRNIGFFADLNALLQDNGGKDFLIEKALEPVFTKMMQEIEEWVNKVGPERFVVSDEQLNSLDWAAVLPPSVAESKVFIKNDPVQISEFLRRNMFNLQNDLARASSASIELNQNLQVRDLLPRIKALRKKLDTENMAQFKAIIENGDYETAKQIIDLHYIEYPNFYERLRSEMAKQQDEGEDKKSMALINSLLNDLSTASGNMETGKYIRNQNNIPYINQKISSFRQKNMQLFDIQDELTRTKNIANESKKASADLKQLTTLNMVLLVIMILLTVVLLVVVLMKNFGLEKNVARLESNFNSFQETFQVLESATAVPTEQPAVTPTVPIPPTVVPNEPVPLGELQTQEESAQLTADALLSPADLHLRSLVGSNVTLNLDLNVDLFGDELMTEDKKFGVVIANIQNIPAKLVEYSDTMVNVEIPFNIGKSRLANNNLMVTRGTNIRQFTSPPSESATVFISQTEMNLLTAASGCGEAIESFCNGSVSLWIQRDKVVTYIQ